ncbi:MAG TPA: phosphoesterase [Hyphomicrobiaceae bacterium]|nr:phosphoesterase [Hyphomicrobiaceae bacterium]
MLELKSERLHLLAEAPGQQLAMGGQSLLADHSGAIYWPAEEVLVVADLRLDAAAAEPAPRELLIRLAEVIDRYQPRRVVALGGASRSAGREPQIATADLTRLGILQEDREWIWLDDRADAEIAARPLGGRVAKALRLAGISLRHRPAAGSVAPEIAGSLNPAARLSHYGTSMRRPCFVANRRRLIMPAFAAVAGGRNVLDEAFRPLFGNDGMAVWLLGQEALYPVASRLLSGE